MKLAFITDDERSISRHFGRAQYYLIVTIEGGKITRRERRDKLGHAHFADTPPAEEPHHPHGMGPTAESRHAAMLEGISDCEALFCGGMGRGAYESVKSRGIKPIVTEITDIDAAVQAYLDGKVVDRIERLH